MIQFAPLLSWTWTWIFIAVIMTLLAVQLLWITKRTLSPARKWLKSILNAALLFALTGYLLQPVWKSSRSEEGILVVSNSISNEKIRYWKDSLKLKEAIRFDTYRGEGNPVYLLGSEFSQLDLMKFKNKKLHWIQEENAGELSFLSWKGVLRQGETQTIAGKLVVEDSAHLVLSQAGVELAEAFLKAGPSDFKFQLPVSLIGRNELDLHANDSLVGKVRYFSTAPVPIKFTVQLAFPGAEVRFLIQFLTSTGHAVNEEIKVSKNTTIHASAASDSTQFIIIDPAQLSDATIKSAIEAGASVLLMNLGDVYQDIARLNKLVKSNFEVTRTSNAESRAVQPDLDSEPFQFAPKVVQEVLLGNSVTIQQVGNSKIGVSLLKETYPIKLSGDSLRYRAIWEEILGAMRPESTKAVEIMEPFFVGLPHYISIYQETYEADFVVFGADTLYLQQSLVNPYGKSGSLVTSASGWIKMADSLEVYVYAPDEWPSLHAAKLRSDFLTGRSGNSTLPEEQLVKKQISDWVWYGLFLGLFALLWLEPKVLNS